MKPIDLRSDTVTRPSPAMRQAMAGAEVGDDVYGEDPTVRRLEDRVAELLGKDAALFVPTGTMGNQVSIRVLGRPATEVVLEARSHIFNAEMAAMAGLSGLLPRPVVTPDGILTSALAEAALQPDSPIRPKTSLIAVENTHNYWSGKTMPAEALDGLRALSQRKGLPLHLDGSRLWNASVATGTGLAELARGFATVNVCFSKGLGAPVGSAVAGSREVVAEARRMRKLFGGGMRQSGVLAAAALVALENIARLAEDHARARRLTDALAEIDGISLDPSAIDTNIVIFSLAGRAPIGPFVARLAEQGVLASQISATEARFVTHLDIGDGDIDRAIEAAARALTPNR